MKISARLSHYKNKLETILQTNEISHSLTLEPKSSGLGSATNGGELLFLALAVCYCNDIYREAQKRGIKINQVNVSVNGEFGSEGEPANNLTYDVRVEASADSKVIEDLIRHTDEVAEIHNTIRKTTPVVLHSVRAIEI